MNPEKKLKKYLSQSVKLLRVDSDMIVKLLDDFTAEQVSITYDVPSFFEYYDIISAKALSARIGMNNTLLSHYISGIKKPFRKQVEKILTGIKEVGRELMQLEIR